MDSIVTTFRGAVIKVEAANFCAAMDTLIRSRCNYMNVVWFDANCRAQQGITICRKNQLEHVAWHFHFPSKGAN